MSKKYENLTKKLSDKFISLAKKVFGADYSKPKNFLLLIAALVLHFTAWHYVSTGLVLGLLKAIGILFFLDKSPTFIKDLVAKYPLAADLILTSLMLVVIGGYFGAGLTLGLGAAFAMIILSWALPIFAEEHRKTQGETMHEEFATA